MPTHSTAAQNAATDAVTALIDAGGGAGSLVCRTAADAEVATLPFSATSFAASASGVATANPITTDASATGGTMTKFAFVDFAAVDHVLGTITGIAGGGDIEATSTVVGAGDPVACSSLTYQALIS